VLIYRKDYKQKVDTFISNMKVVETKDNITDKFQKKLRSPLNYCKQLVETRSKWKHINLNPDAPVLRGLIKVHKEDAPIRPVVNYKSAPSYNLAKWFAKVLKEYIPLPNIYNVPNSVHLMKELADIPYAPDLRLASLDISNMFSHIPVKELLDIIEITCRNNTLEPTVIQEILQITNLITAQNYFKFQDKTFLQTDGLAMGAPTSSVLPELYIQYLENTTILDILCKFKILGHFRYVDDILIVYN